MIEESKSDGVQDPKADQDEQAMAGTGNEEQDDLETAREMATIVPTPAEQLDSATIPGAGPPPEKIVLDGDSIPGYDLLGELGRGGMGVVYKARDQKLKRIVALKMILSGTHASEEDMQRFQIEAEAVAKLQHPNIVQIFEVAEHEGRPYIALEFADGGSLDQKIAGVPQNATESAQLVETLARAMQQAHDNEIIHRDLKPANILLTADGVPRITDFGLAKRMDDDSTQTKSGAVMGTPSYMAPEQAASTSSTLGPPADTYALGAILYHMLTGRPPFQAETQLDTIIQVIGEEPVSPRKLNSSLPVDLETICLKCLEKDVHRRYESAEALAEDLRRFGAGEPIQARPVSVITRGLKWAKRRPAVAGMIGISAGALVALVAGGLWYNAQLVDERDIATQQTKVARQQTQLAKTREHEAEQARAKEEEQKTVAQQQRLLAEKREGEANQARSEEEKQRKLTEQQRTLAEERERDANQARRRAEKAEVEVRESEREARQSAYIADMQLLSQDWENKRLDHLKERLARHAGEEDLLGFEWHYWNQLVHAELHNLKGHAMPIIAARYFPGKGKVATADLSGMVSVWESKTGVLARRFQIKGLTSPAEVVLMSPRMDRFATADSNGMVQVLDFQSEEVLQTFEGLTDGVFHMEMSPDGLRLACASGDRVRIFDIERAEELLVLEGHQATVRRVAYSGDGKWVATGDADGVIKFWDHESGKETFSAEGHAGRVTDLDYSSNGKWLASCGADNIVKTWDATTGKEVHSFAGHEREVHAVVFSPDSGQLVSGGMDQTIKIWEMASGKETASFKHNSAVRTITVSPDGQRILSGTMSGEVKIWDPARIPAVQRIPGNREDGTCIKFSPDGLMLVATGEDNTVNIWDVTTLAKSRTLTGHQDQVNSVAFSPDGTRIVSGSDDGTVKLWDSNSGQELKSLEGHEGNVRSVAFSPDGTHVASTGEDGTVRLWDLSEGHQVHSLSAGKSFVPRVIFSADGRHLHAAGAQRGLGIITSWEIETGRVTTRWPATAGDDIPRKFTPVLSIATHHGNLAYATNQALSHGVVKIRRKHVEGILTIECSGMPVFSVAYSPNGQRLVTAGHDRMVRIWDAKTGRAMSILQGHESGVYGAVFSPDETRLASLGRDGTIIIWDGRPLSTATDSRQIAVQDPDKVELLVDRGALYLQHANLQEQIGEYPAAWESWKEAEKIFTSILEKDADQKTRHTLADIYLRMGLLELKGGAKEDVSPYQLKAIDLYASLVAEDKSNKTFVEQLCVARNNLAVYYRIKGKHEESMAVYEATRKIADDLVSEAPDGYLSQFVLAQNLAGMGYLLLDMDQVADGIKKYLNAIEVYEKLTREFPTEQEASTATAETFSSLWTIYREQGNSNGALVSIKRSVEIMKKLSLDNPANVNYLNSYAEYSAKLANSYRELENPVEAIVAMTVAAEIRTQLYQMYPGSGYRDLTGLTLLAIGAWQFNHTMSGDEIPEDVELKKTLSASRDFIEFFQACATESPENPEYPQYILRGYRLLGVAFAKAGRKEQAKENFLELISLQERFIENHPETPDFANEVPLPYRGLIKLASEEGDHALLLDLAASLGRLKVPDEHQAVYLYNAACVVSLASGAVALDEDVPETERMQLTEKHAVRAMEMLAEARAAGWFQEAKNIAHAKETDTELDPLRERDDFKQFVKELDAVE